MAAAMFTLGVLALSATVSSEVRAQDRFRCLGDRRHLFVLFPTPYYLGYHHPLPAVNSKKKGGERPHSKQEK
jgi:hypothetical protein